MKRVWWLVTGVIVSSVTATCVYLFLQSRPTPQAPTQKPAVTQKNTEVQLALPGASAIPALKEDYQKSSSLWVVVSKDHPLADVSYAPASISRLSIALNTSKSADELSLRSDIVPMVEALFTAAKAAGYDIMLASGYRSYTLQKTYYDNYVRVSGETEANKFSAKPGQSEHQTGLAFDISLTNRSCYLETCFADTDAAKWLAAHAFEYGFVLRYPADKTDVTKYQYEPWHFRYVGKDLARALHDSGLTLDEAYGYLQATRQKLLDQKLIATE